MNDDILLEKIERIVELERMVRETSLENEQLRVEVAKLKPDALKLEALWQSGVDNWDGFYDAMDLYKEWLELDAENTRAISAEGEVQGE